MAGMMNPGLTVDDVYPVGSIYMSVNATDPGKLFGGTWQRIKERFLLGTGDTHGAGSTGGEFEHTLTVEEMPKHSHSMPSNSAGGTVLFAAWIPRATDWTSSDYYGHSLGVTTAGGNSPHNITPPPIWQFTSGIAQHSQYKGVAACVI